MFQFLRRRPKDVPDPLQTHRTAVAWLRQLPANDVIARQGQVLRAFEDLARSSVPIDLGCVSAIEMLDAELGADRGQLLRQYIESAETSNVLADRIWQAAYEASQGFIGVYRRIIGEALKQANQPGWNRILPRLFARLMHFYGTDAKLRVLRNERWIPAKWVEVHELYQRALQLGIAHTPIGPAQAGNDAPGTVEQEYIAVLLTHLLNTGSFTPGEVDWAGGQVRTWCRGLKLDTAPRPSGGFYVDIAGRSGLARRTGSDEGTELRFLDTAPLVVRIQHAIAANRRQEKADQDPSGLKTQQRASTLERLRPTLAPDLKTAFSRGARVRRSQAAEIRIGLLRICLERAFHKVDVDAFVSPRQAPGSGGASDPRAARETVTRDDVDGARVVIGAEPGWRVEDRSVGGMRIKAPAHGGQGMALGALIAVGEPGVDDWVLGIVRRLNRSAAEVEAGIAVIARETVAVRLNLKRQAREDMSIVVDGIDVSTVGAAFDGLYLPPPSRLDNPIKAKSLIIPTTEFGEGRHLVLITGQTVYTLVLRKVIEQRPEWTWAVMEVVDRTTRTVTPAA